jgi:hypothetical protein
MSRPASSVDLELALARARRGEIHEAARDLTDLVRAYPSDPDPYYHLARIYAGAGLRAAAKDVFRLALVAAPEHFLNARTFVEYEGKIFDALTALSYFDALVEVDPAFNKYVKPSELVGSYAASQTTEQDHVIEQLLAARWADWGRGSSTPAGAGVFRKHTLPQGSTWPRVLILMTEHVSGNPAFVTNTLASHTVASLVELGAPVSFYPADHIAIDTANSDSCWPGRMSKSRALAALETHISDFRPDVVVMDAMFEESPESLSRAELGALKSRYGFKLVSMVADSYPPLPNYAAHWAALSDLTVTFTDHGYLASVPGRAFAAPCQPIAASLFKAAPEDARDIGFCYIGSRRRNRDLWCAHVVHAGIEATIRLTDRRADRGLTEQEYYQLIGRSRIVFNNGEVASGIHILTFRIFEAMASGTLLINHAAGPISDYFVPYVHYVPVENVHELVCFSRFFLSHPEYRLRMAEEARIWLESHYSGELFWRSVFARLSGN